MSATCRTNFRYLPDEHRQPAGRLHTVLEILLEDISYTASDRSGEKEIITAQMVEEKLAKYTEASDLSKFIL